MDDDPVVLHILSALLDEHGIEAVPASSGRAGLRALSEEILSLDLLITDLNMPDLTGDALVLAVRELGGERDLPILVLSSGVDPEHVRALRMAGADAVVDKGAGLAPVTAAALSLLAARGRPPASIRPGPRAAACGASVPLFRIGLTRR